LYRAKVPALVTQFDTLVRASRLYYELGETQGRIAELLGVTRPQVSKLLKQARAEGIVEIRIVDRTAQASPAADRLGERFELRGVHVAPTIAGPDDLTRRSVGRLAADVLRSSVRDGMVVGIGDGAAVSATADALEGALTPVAATVVPLAGGFWFETGAREPFRRVADALGAVAHGLLAPGVVDDAATKAALSRHAGLQAVFDLWNRLDVALFGIGGASWTPASVGSELCSRIEDDGAVGEVLISPLTLDGRFVAGELRDRVIAFDARALHRVPVTIGVAAGEAKTAPILAALRAGTVNTLVTDAATAEAVVRLAHEAAP
jgi:deoxyribonucleoside regulator